MTVGNNTNTGRRWPTPEPNLPRVFQMTAPVSGILVLHMQSNTCFGRQLATEKLIYMSLSKAAQVP